MSKKKVVKKELSPKQEARKVFQDMVESAKKCDFKCDTMTIPCPEAGEGINLVLHAITMDDQEEMRKFSSEHEGCPLWVAVLMFSAKDEDGEYIFTGEDGIRFIESQGVKWYRRYGIRAMELAGYTEEFTVAKK